MQKVFRRPGRTLSGREQKAGLAPGTPVFVGERKQEKVKIEILSYSPDRVEENRDASLKDCLRNRPAGGVTWIKATSSGIRPLLNRAGISERKTGV